MVLAPTRELANQTEQACRDLAPKNIKCAILIGGAGYRSQENALRRGADIIVATPGRLVDFMEQGLINFSPSAYARPRRSRPHARYGFSARHQTHRENSAD